MNVFRLVCAGLLGALSAVPTVRADELIVSPTGHRSATGHHAPYPNRRWPGPFPATDRNSVEAAFRAVEDQGWLRAHTLGDHLFDPVNHVREFVNLLPARAGQLQVAEIDADPLEVPALNAAEANRQTRLPPVHNLSPQPLFFGYGAGAAQRE